jgi:hypothetical protein
VLRGNRPQNSGDGLQLLGRTSARSDGPVVERGGDPTHGGALVAQPPDLGQRFLLSRLWLDVLRLRASDSFDLAFHRRDNRSQSGKPYRILLAKRMDGRWHLLSFRNRREKA